MIHIEQLWQENLLTVEGRILHEKAHDAQSSERRADKIITRGMPVQSACMGVNGVCDVVEFVRDEENGVALTGYEARWLPVPVEYKRGRPKSADADRLQLCAQAMCLEEMLCCRVPEGFLFYGETRRRERVSFDDALRTQVKVAFEQMHDCLKHRHTPKVKPSTACRACSMRDMCLPVLCKNRSAAVYIQKHMEEEV